MARTKGAAPEVKETPANMQVIDAEREAANALALAHIEQNERVMALAKQFDYRGSTDPAVLENCAMDAIRRIGMTLFELGAYLLLLKEACPHGTFLPTLERMHLSADAAGRYMAVTRRFANSASMRNLEAVGLTKMVEMLALDDEQIDELTSIGQVGELALDDVARMSVKELRAAVRKERNEKDRLKSVTEELNSEVVNLKQAARHIKAPPPDQKLAELTKEAASLTADALGLIRGNVGAALGALAQHYITHGGEPITITMAGLIGQLQAELNALREQYNLPDISAAEDAQLASEVAQWAPNPAAH